MIDYVKLLGAKRLLDLHITNANYREMLYTNLLLVLKSYDNSKKGNINKGLDDYIRENSDFYGCLSSIHIGANLRLFNDIYFNMLDGGIKEEYNALGLTELLDNVCKDINTYKDLVKHILTVSSGSFRVDTSDYKDAKT